MSNERPNQSKTRVPIPKRFYKVAKSTANAKGWAKPYKKNEGNAPDFEYLKTDTEKYPDQDKTVCSTDGWNAGHDEVEYTCSRKTHDVNTTSTPVATTPTRGASVPMSNDRDRWLLRPNMGFQSSQEKKTVQEPSTSGKPTVKDTFTSTRSMKLDGSFVEQKSAGYQKETYSAACQTEGRFDAYYRYVDHIRQGAQRDIIEEKSCCNLNDAKRSALPKCEEAFEDNVCTAVKSGSSILRNNDAHITLSDHTKCVRFSAFDELKIKENDSLTRLQGNAHMESVSYKQNASELCGEKCKKSKEVIQNQVPLLDTQHLFYDISMDLYRNVSGVIQYDAPSSLD